MCFAEMNLTLSTIARRVIVTFVVLGTIATAGSAIAQPLRIDVENLSPTGGFFLTPLWYGLHDGGFDLFDVGGAATPGLELIAEDGDPSVLEAEFAAPGRLQGVVLGENGFNPPPLIDTGESTFGIQQVFNPVAYRYFSFASMVIPSNDAFIGNENPTAYELYDAGGNFVGPLVIDIFGDEIWDAGTEVNDTMGAAFSTVGGVASDEGGTVQVHPGLGNFEGTGTPVGDIGAGLAPSADVLFARITISQVPEPASLGLALGTAACCLAWRPRRRR